MMNYYITDNLYKHHVTLILLINTYTYTEPVLLSSSSWQPVSCLLRLISLLHGFPVDSDSDSEGISSGNFSGGLIHCSSKMHAINYFLFNMIRNIMYKSQRPYISQTHPMNT